MNKHKNKTKVNVATSTPKSPLLRLQNITNQVRVPKLFLSKELLSSINYAHSVVGNDEWSGTLIYKFNDSKFSIHELYDTSKEEEITITAEKFLLRDIGSSTLTEFELTNDQVVEQMELQMKGLRCGLIHTHHNMRAYFSGTDETELKENTPAYEVYLSLVVNHGDKNNYVARLCWKGQIENVVEKKVKHSFNFLDKIRNVKNKAEETTTEDVIFFIDLEIVRESTGELYDAIQRCLKANEAAKKAKAATVRSYTPTSHTNNGVGNIRPAGTPVQSKLGFDTTPGANKVSKVMESTGAKKALEVVRNGQSLSNTTSDIRETLARLQERGLSTTVNTAFTNISPFLVQWFAGNLNDKRPFYNFMNTLSSKTDEQIDELMDEMSSRFEEYVLQYFGTDDDPLHCLEIMLICYAIKDIVDYPPHNSKYPIIAMVEFLDNTVIEEEERLLEMDIEELGINKEAVRSEELEETEEMNVGCFECDSTGFVNFGFGNASCPTCQGTAVASPMNIH